jgi:hypothetical protein
VCMELDMHCMGLHDHSKGPNSMPNALWSITELKWSWNWQCTSLYNEFQHVMHNHA